MEGVTNCQRRRYTPIEPNAKGAYFCASRQRGKKIRSLTEPTVGMKRSDQG